MAPDRDFHENAPESVDPRVRRTREHVLSVARELLNEAQSALTLSIVAERAEVARQTLYTHWGTIENLVADTIVLSRTKELSDYDGLDARSRAELFFTELVETLNPAMASATSSILAALHYDPNAAQAFVKLDESLYAAFVESVGPVSHDQFVELVAPVLFMVLPRATVSRQMIMSLSERAAQFIR